MYPSLSGVHQRQGRLKPPAREHSWINTLDPTTLYPEFAVETTPSEQTRTLW